MKITNLLNKKFNSKFLAKEIFARDVLKGLLAENKNISSKYFYDDLGSKIFQKITRHKDYYPTRKEIEILSKNISVLPKIINDKKIDIIELGPGDGSKSKIIIESFISSDYKVNYYPIDISRKALNLLGKKIKSHNKLFIHGIIGEYLPGLKFIKNKSKNLKLVLFLGSNIGNMRTKQSEVFLKNIKKNLYKDDYVLVGFDLKKDIKILNKAYNDSNNLTKKFNLNLLKRINNELNGDFQINKFEHIGLYNPKLGAMESYIVSKVNQKVEIKNLSQIFDFAVYEPIHLEYSFKYSIDDIQNLCIKTGFTSVKNFYDSKKYFSDVLWRYN